MRTSKATTIQRKYELLKKVSLNNKEMQELLDCGYERSKQIRNEILQTIKPRKLPGLIPTSLVVRHMQINTMLIIKLAQAENHKGGTQ